ncbi:MAG: DUF177 domain-containing protein [Elusimicrobiota bacterium]|jgi:uncharacterized protein|nr:DUF177 domain-containing protein [Elusimicrobiota bacterium]
MNYKNYEIPTDLVFRTRDIIDMKGLNCSALLNPKDFCDILRPPVKLKEAELKLKFSVLSKEVLAQGNISGVMEAQCSRCLEGFNKSFNEEFTQLYPNKNEIIDIMYIAKQTMALLENIRDICSSECKGLCAICGVNKNRVVCDCKAPSFSQFDCLRNRFNTKNVREE